LDTNCLECRRKRQKVTAQKKRAEQPGYKSMVDRMAARRGQTKVCTDCGEEIANTEEFFSIGPTGATESRCRKCKVRSSNQRSTERMKSDPLFKLRRRLSRQLGCGVKMFGKTKKTKTFDIVDYTAQELFEHLARQLLPGMTWKNHGRKWHIDHIRP